MHWNLQWTGLPWDFQVGPGLESERRQFDRLVQVLPDSSIVVADAGFISYAGLTKAATKNPSLQNYDRLPRRKYNRRFNLGSITPSLGERRRLPSGTY